MRVKATGGRAISAFRPAIRRRELSWLIAAMLASGAAAQHAAAREIPFSEQPPVTAGAEGALSVYVADIDGDGDLDAVSASEDDDKVAWYENVNGDASAWSLHTITTSAAGAASVFAADIDGDGDVDVLSADADDDRITWYENVGGDGGSWTAATISASASNASAVFSADVDGDGDVDVLSASSGSSEIAWHENTAGDGSSWDAVVISNNVIAATDVSTSDVDGDGDPDVLSSSAGNSAVYWHENDGTPGGGNWVLRTVTGSASGAYSVFAADVDGDGDRDVLSAALSGDTIAWHENDGTGGSWTAHAITGNADGAASVFAADLDGDGDLDALSASRNDNKVAWYENVAGDGTTWTTHTLTTSAFGASAVFSADADADGDPDILAAVDFDDEIAWYRNDDIHRSARFPARVTITDSAEGAYSVHAADVDGDGDLDTVSASYHDNKIAWHENGSWTTHTITTAASGAESVFAADVDADGDLDILSASAGDEKIAWYENTDGDGSSWTTHTITTGANNAASVFASDVDGDGEMDVLSASFLDNKIAWYENTDGDGLSWSTHTITIGASIAFSVFAADVDADGDLDVLSASFGDDKIAWYENTDGDGLSWSTHTITTGASEAVSVHAADVDGDGDLDALSASRGDDTVAWYENLSGDGATWTTHTVTNNADGANFVRAADLDRDGDTDVVSASLHDDKVAWYENVDGDGSSWNPRTVTTAASTAFSVHVADVDADGDRDILSASSDDDNVSWYPNRGGQFALPTLDIAQKVAGNGQLLGLLDIQTIHRGRMGDSDVELAAWVLEFTDDTGAALTSPEANALIDEVRLYGDDGSGTFEDGADDLIVTIDTLALTGGVHTETLVDDNANLQAAFGAPGVLFGVVAMAADAESQSPSAFEVTHRTESSSAGENAAHDLPIILEFFPDTGTGVIDTQLDSTSCTAPFDLQLADRSVDDTLVCEAGTVLSAENFNLTGSADVTFRSGDQVTLLPGFNVQDGQFAVEIDPALQP